MGPLGMAGMQLGTNMITGILNNGLQSWQQDVLNRKSMEYNKEMTDYNMSKQLELWNKTGYKPQVEQMKEAGLNPALIYKGAGAGGSTAISPSSGGQGQASSNAMMGIDMAQMSLLEAQKDNIEADTLKKKAEAAKTSGVDTELTKNQIKLTVELSNNEAVKTEINEQIKEQQYIETHIKTMTMNQVVSQAVYQTQSMWETLQGQITQNKISKESADDQIAIIKQQKINLVLQKKVMETGIKVDLKSIEKMSAEIAQGWQGLTLREKEMKVDAVMKQSGLFNEGLLTQMRAGAIGAESTSKQIDEIMNVGKQDFKK